MEPLLNKLVLEFHRENNAEHGELNKKLDRISEKLTGLRIKVAVIGATSGLVTALLAQVARAIAGGN